MADFDEVLAKLRQRTEGENPIPVEIVDDLAAQFGQVNTALEGATIQISEKDQAIAARDAEISKLKSANYDLTVKASALPGQPPQPENNDNRPSGITGLFSPKGKK